MPSYDIAKVVCVTTFEHYSIDADTPEEALALAMSGRELPYDSTSGDADPGEEWEIGADDALPSPVSPASERRARALAAAMVAEDSGGEI